MRELALGAPAGVIASPESAPQIWSLAGQRLRAKPEPPEPLAPPALTQERMDEVLIASWNARRRG